MRESDSKTERESVSVWGGRMHMSNCLSECVCVGCIRVCVCVCEGVVVGWW